MLVLTEYVQYEAVPESLKNVVLVMNTTDMLVPPVEGITRTERQRALWEAITVKFKVNSRSILRTFNLEILGHISRYGSDFLSSGIK